MRSWMVVAAGFVVMGCDREETGNESESEAEAESEGECTDGLIYAEPGCSPSPGYALPSPDCYETCDVANAPCPGGQCQSAWVNPCPSCPSDDPCCAEGVCGAERLLCIVGGCGPELVCSEGSVCVRSSAGGPGVSYRCAVIDPNCPDGQPSCACMNVCADYQTCSESTMGLHCSCPECA